MPQPDGLSDRFLVLINNMITGIGSLSVSDRRAIAPWDAILKVAVFTPSPHNTQPWRVRVLNRERAMLFVERARLLPDEDTTGHFLRCAMGMFLEMMRIASANVGYAFEFQLLDDRATGPFIPFATMELRPSPIASTYSDSLIRQRVTSRLGSNGVRIDPRITAFLKDFELQSGHRYHQLDDAALIEQLVDENIRAVFHDLNDRPYHDEIVRWFRYSDAEARRKADGLDCRCMRAGRLELQLMKHLPQAMRWRLTRSWIRSRYRRQLGDFSHIGIISGPFFDDAGCLSGGTFLMRFWLELARRDIHIHPMGNLVTNAQARARVIKLTNVADPWLVFRIGHTDSPPRAYRRSIAEVLLDD